jgi:hypothetical protein
MHKNDSYIIKSIFATPQKQLNIFENSLKQFEDLDHIFHFLKQESILVDLWRSSKDKQWCQAALVFRGLVWSSLLPNFGWTRTRTSCYIYKLYQKLDWTT